MATDIVFESHSSVVLITPKTDKGKEWISENIHFEPWQAHAGGVCVDIRSAPAIFDGALKDGLEVSQ